MSKIITDSAFDLQTISKDNSDARQGMETAIRFYTHGVGDNPDPTTFFRAWNISPAIIAERLRRMDFNHTADEIRAMIKNGIKTQHERYILSVAMMEMKNDISTTLDR